MMSTAPYSSARSVVAAPVLGQARADDHRDRVLGHDLAQEGQPVHARHLDVQRDDVRDLAADLLGGDVGVGGGAHHRDFRVGREDLGEGLAHDRRVVDDQHADRACPCRPPSSARHAVDRGTHGGHRQPHAVDALGVPEEEVAPRGNPAAQPQQQLALELLLEVDQHVPAEDHVERAADREFRLAEVQALEADAGAQLGHDPHQPLRSGRGCATGSGSAAGPAPARRAPRGTPRGRRLRAPASRGRSRGSGSRTRPLRARNSSSTMARV